jgi:hypothetical protein
MSLFPRHGDSAHSGMEMGDSHGASGTASDANGSMDGSHGMSMTMLFQNTMATPLYSATWTPNNTGAYAGTCIFLIVLAIIARVLLAIKSQMEARWLDHEERRIYGSAPSSSTTVVRDAEARKTRVSLSDNGVDEAVVAVQRKRTAVHPWRLSVDPVRAVMDVLIVGVGYLL